MTIDDKRFLIPDQLIETPPLGHYKIPPANDLVPTEKHPQKYSIPAAVPVN